MHLSGAIKIGALNFGVAEMVGVNGELHGDVVPDFAPISIDASPFEVDHDRATALLLGRQIDAPANAGFGVKASLILKAIFRRDHGKPVGVTESRQFQEDIRNRLPRSREIARRPTRIARRLHPARLKMQELVIIDRASDLKKALKPRQIVVVKKAAAGGAHSQRPLNLLTSQPDRLRSTRPEPILIIFNIAHGATEPAEGPAPVAPQADVRTGSER